MTRASLASLLKHAKKLPTIVLAFDESLSTETLQDSLSDWPGEMVCWSREDTSRFHDAQGESGLAEFCRRDIFGFKLAACKRASQNSRTLYCDADVLWFHDCGRLMKKHADRPLYGSTDLGKSVDDETVSLLSPDSQHLVLQEPRVCAGFAIYNTPIEFSEEITQVIETLIAKECIGRLAEQTLVGLMVRERGELIDFERVPMLRPISAKFGQDHISEDTFACHYPGELKTQLWIDFLRHRWRRAR